MCKMHLLQLMATHSEALPFGRVAFLRLEGRVRELRIQLAVGRRPRKRGERCLRIQKSRYCIRMCLNDSLKKLLRGGFA